MCYANTRILVITHSSYAISYIKVSITFAFVLIVHIHFLIYIMPHYITIACAYAVTHHKTCTVFDRMLIYTLPIVSLAMRKKLSFKFVHNSYILSRVCVCFLMIYCSFI